MTYNILFAPYSTVWAGLGRPSSSSLYLCRLEDPIQGGLGHGGGRRSCWPWRWFSLCLSVLLGWASWTVAGSGQSPCSQGGRQQQELPSLLSIHPRNWPRVTAVTCWLVEVIGQPRFEGTGTHKVGGLGGVTHQGHPADTHPTWSPSLPPATSRPCRAQGDVFCFLDSPCSQSPLPSVSCQEDESES